jgi:hypothetical protein
MQSRKVFNHNKQSIWLYNFIILNNIKMPFNVLQHSINVMTALCVTPPSSVTAVTSFCMMHAAVSDLTVSSEKYIHFSVRQKHNLV